MNVMKQKWHEQQLQQQQHQQNTGDDVFDFFSNNFFITDSQEEKEAEEMQLALKAYLQIAIKRFIDAIPMHLNQNFLELFLKKMEIEMLRISDLQIENLLREDEHERTRRKELDERLECLAKAKKECLYM
jgi:hypothetical protein